MLAAVGGAGSAGGEGGVGSADGTGCVDCTDGAEEPGAGGTNTTGCPWAGALPLDVRC